MKSKSGLHKQVSSIFDGVAVPDASSPAESRSEARQGGALSLATATEAAGNLQNRQAVAQKSYAAPKPQTRKSSVTLMFLLMIVLSGVVYWNYIKPNLLSASDTFVRAPVKVKPKQVEPVTVALAMVPEWPADLRDPMQVPEPAEPEPDPETVLDEAAPPSDPATPQLNGIVYKPNGQGSALFGHQIAREGDIVENHTVDKILRDHVQLTNKAGKAMVLWISEPEQQSNNE